MSNYQLRRAAPTDAERIAAAHVDSIQSIGPGFYPSFVVVEWSAGIRPQMYVDAMTRGETFFIAVDAHGPHATATFPDHQTRVLGFSSQHGQAGHHRTAVYVRGSAARRGVGSALFR